MTEWINIGLQALSLIVGMVGGSVGIIFWRENKRIKASEADKGKTEAQRAEADLAESILEKYEKAILARMESGETVRKQEFDQLRTDIGSQLSDIQVENRSQNEIIAQQNDLLTDIKEYLNGGFAEFEQRKHAQRPSKKPKK